MAIVIKEVSEIQNKIPYIKDFIFDQIKKEYNGDINPQYHYDILEIEKYYFTPQRNNLFVAMEGDEIIGTIAVRGYNKSFDEFKGKYDKDTTASIWRLFVDEKFRRNKLATKLYTAVEEFSKENNYKYIYLHTHKNLEGALLFWQKMGFDITLDTDDEFQTVHMHKNLIKLDLDYVEDREESIIKS